MVQKLSSDFLRFTPTDSSVGVEAPASCANRRSFYIFQANCFRKCKSFNKWTHNSLTLTSIS